MSRHSFDPEIAGRVGLNAAVIFQNITFWIEKNQANRRNLRDGRYWTYNSISAFSELFPYLSEKQIRTALEKLVSAELIIKGNFSDDRYDRTCWYALGNSICPNGQIDPTERENDAFAPEGKPSAPEGKSYKNRYKPYQKPNPSHAKAAVEDEISERILATYPEDRVRGKAACISQIRQALADGVDAKDIEDAVRAYATESEGFTRSKVCFSDNGQGQRGRVAERLGRMGHRSPSTVPSHHARPSDRLASCKPGQPRRNRGRRAEIMNATDPHKEQRARLPTDYIGDARGLGVGRGTSAQARPPC